VWWHESVIITPCHLIFDRYEFLGAPATFANLKYFTLLPEIGQRCVMGGHLILHHRYL